MISPGDILQKHLKDLELSDQERADVEATFKRIVRIGRDALDGADVESDLVHLEAQIALWKSGALSATQAALWAAAKDYAEKAGELLGRVIKAALSSLI